ncbi:imidazolonepropionase [Microaceticoccus formicicus]|uniref:imidazolonepropionase n=1 Tax=Microaceticoccus formicicus TaxID=3118105 RepID=UPI003CD015F0|nr:imidazolonepropionase [Peptoniphilaceae bacterium AMB_02]
MSNIIIKNATQLATPVGDSKRCGSEMSELLVIEDAALIIEDGKIVKVGKTSDVLNGVDEVNYEVIDATGKTIMPGFVDSHTHFVFGGYRDDEFNKRLMGVSYMEIMNAGGGIKSTVKATHEESHDQLMNTGRQRLNSMLSFGVTTVEGKSGYGLDIETELKQLDVMEDLNKEHPIDIVKTYMAAHDIPEEYKGRTSEFVDFIIEKGLDTAVGKAVFCDIFTEKNVFEIEDSRRLLLAAKEKGFKLKMHADEIVQLGGSELAAELKTVSADHLLKASDQGIKDMIEAGTVMTLLPSTAFSLKEPYARARFMIDNGAAVALGSDFNPGSCHTNSIPLMIALATIYMKMSVEETITALTLNGAAALDMTSDRGSLEIGKIGDVIILNAPSYKHLSYTIAVNLVEKVIKAGELVYDKTLAFDIN